MGVVLAGLGYEVTGIDLSPAMIALAKRKAAAAGAAVRFKVMDAAFPRLAVARYDALVCRHVAWALPEIEQVLRRWARLLKRGGSLLMIEGFWHTGSGIHAQDAANLIPPGLELRTVRDLSQNTGLWGGPVQDERYLLSAVKVS